MKKHLIYGVLLASVHSISLSSNSLTLKIKDMGLHHEYYDS